MSSNLISTSIQLGSERKNYLPVVAKLIHDKAGNPARCVCFPGSQKERFKTAAEAGTVCMLCGLGWAFAGFVYACVCTQVCVCAEAGGRRQASSSTVVQLLF